MSTWQDIEDGPPIWSTFSFDPTDYAPCYLPGLIVDCFGGSKSDVRRLIEQGAVKVDLKKFQPEKFVCTSGDLAGSVLQVGKRKFVRIVKEI